MWTMDNMDLDRAFYNLSLQTQKKEKIHSPLLILLKLKFKRETVNIFGNLSRTTSAETDPLKDIYVQRATHGNTRKVCPNKRFRHVILLLLCGL
jgi:hypothetical protein